jgi:hypothetical protein
MDGSRDTATHRNEEAVCGEVGVQRVTRRAQPKTANCALSSESFVPKGTVRLSVLVVKWCTIDSGEKLMQIWVTDWRHE